jgi:hypothetical protein
MAIVITRGVVLAASLDEIGENAPILGWQNLVSLSAVAASYQDANYPASNLANPSTAQFWKSTSAATQYLTFDLTGLDPVDYVGIARHNLGSGTVAVSVEMVDPNDAGLWLEVASSVLLPDDGPAILRFAEIFPTQLRLKLQPSATIPRVAVVYVGKLLVLQRGIQPGHVPLPFAASDEIVTGQAESGDFLGRIVTRQSLTTSVSILGLDYDWFHQHMASFVKKARTTPFFFAWMPEAYPHEVGYAWINNDVRPETQLVQSGIVVAINLELGAVAL